MSYNSDLAKRTSEALQVEERSVVCFCVYAQTQDIGTVAALLQPEDFGDADSRLGFEVILRLLQSGGAVSLFTFLSEMRAAGQESSSQLILETRAHEILNVGDVKVIARRIVEAAQKRAFRDAITRAERDFDIGGKSLEEMRSTLLKALCSRTDQAVVRISDALRKRAEELTKPQIPGLLTPWNNVNDYWGELEPGELIIIGARPKIGKTAFVGQLCQSWASQYGPGLMMSLEMTVREMCDRVIRFQCQLDGRIQRTHSELVRGLADKLEEMGFYIVSGSQTKPTMEQRLRAFKAQFPQSRFAVLDYLQLLEWSEGEPEGQTQFIGSCVKRAKNLCVDLDLVLVVLSQLTRTAADVEPEMNHLLDSGAIEAAGNKIALLYAEDPTRIVVKTAGNRSGPVGKAMLRFDAAKMTFTDWHETTKPRVNNARRREAPPMRRVQMEEMPLGEF